jgi:hypothetical protein
MSIWKGLNLEAVRELVTSYELYVSAYDRSLDDRPPLDFGEWAEMYGPDVLREARERGDLAVTR